MSLTTYGKSLKVHDFTFTTDGSGDATQALNIDGVVERIQFEVTASTIPPNATFSDDEGNAISHSYYPRVGKGLVLYGGVVINIRAQASKSGRCRVYVR